MRKWMNWMLAAILICSANVMTSCSNEDNPVNPEPALPDQAYMFMQNVLSDARYIPGLFEISDEDGSVSSEKVLRFYVNSYEEAQEEFLKLLPEGVAATAFALDDFYQSLFSEATGYRLNAPAMNGEDVVSIHKTKDLVSSILGYAWVELTPDLKVALDAEMIIYVQSTDDDDLANFINSLMNIIPYCTPDVNDSSHLICTVPTEEAYIELVLAFITTKMMKAMVPTEEGYRKVTLTDSQDNVYGYLYIVAPEHAGGALNVYLLDEALQASLAAQIGMPFSKISFYVAGGE